MPSAGKLQLTAGRFYRARNGQTWCCFRARPLVKDYGLHSQAMCIRVTDYKINYYLDDRSFDEGGEVEEGDLTRDRFSCQYCGNRLKGSELNYDHVVPRAKGGRTVWENIVTSCYPCNSKKANRTPEEAGLQLLSAPARPRTLPLNGPVIDLSDSPVEWAPYLGSQ